MPFFSGVQGSFSCFSAAPAGRAGTAQAICKGAEFTTGRISIESYQTAQQGNCKARKNEWFFLIFTQHGFFFCAAASRCHRGHGTLDRLRPEGAEGSWHGTARQHMGSAARAAGAPKQPAPKPGAPPRSWRDQGHVSLRRMPKFGIPPTAPLMPRPKASPEHISYQNPSFCTQKSHRGARKLEIQGDPATACVSTLPSTARNGIPAAASVGAGSAPAVGGGSAKEGTQNSTNSKLSE